MSKTTANSIPVVVAGALGRMGAQVVRTIYSSNDCHLLGAIDNAPDKQGEDIGLSIGLPEMNIPITSDFEGCQNESRISTFQPKSLKKSITPNPGKRPGSDPAPNDPPKQFFYISLDFLCFSDRLLVHFW